MVTKSLRKKEVELGFISIPAKDRIELVGEQNLPFETKLNDFPAKIDKQGRLWCKEYLKGRFSKNSEVTLIKNDSGYAVSPNGQEPVQMKKTAHAILCEPAKKARNSVTESTSLQQQSEASQIVLEGDCLEYLRKDAVGTIDLTFFDPPYLQGKEYKFFDDTQTPAQYWDWITKIIQGVYQRTSDGGAIYFMHREKNAERILRILRKTGWNFQNLIIWKKKTSAVPIATRFSKQYQIIAYAIKGKRPRVFNKVRIDPPPLPEHKYEHENGVFLTDVWDDIRELTSGYFAGDEAIRDQAGNRTHVQQTPVALLLRIVLSSSSTGDIMFDPTAGTGTALVVAKQLGRKSVGIEIDPAHTKLIKDRLSKLRKADDVSKYYQYYRFTNNLQKIWPTISTAAEKQRKLA
jgi:site-specific DNA-methyltransferase (adenine-specific)